MHLSNLIQKIEEKGFVVFEDDSKPFNLNIVGVRSSDMTPDKFNDDLFVFWKYKGKWSILNFKLTTDPGLYYLKKPMNVKGTIIMQPGQYRGVYQLGKHKGLPALRQVKPMNYWRDDNRDAKFDKLNRETSLSYTNLHRAGFESSMVGKWSAGCQVMANEADAVLLFEHLIPMALKYWGNSFTYTLIEK